MLKAAEAINMTLDEEAVHMTNGTYHVQPHTGDTWHWALPADDSMEGISPLTECVLQGNDIWALAKVAKEWVREAGGMEPGGENREEWKVGAIRRVRYRRGGWMTRENTKLISRMVLKGPAAAQWRGQVVHMLLPDDILGDRGTMVLELRHRQEARYQYNVPAPNIVVTTAAAEGMQVRIWLSREGQAVQVYTMEKDKMSCDSIGSKVCFYIYVSYIYIFAN